MSASLAMSDENGTGDSTGLLLQAHATRKQHSPRGDFLNRMILPRWRVGRIVIPGVPHHITQRGNNRQDVFFVDDDRRVYLELLAAQAERFGLKLLGYCLMDNHVHLVATPAGEASLARAVGRTHFLYTQYVNRLHGRSGHLWQNRFYSCALDDEHLWNALVYVETKGQRGRTKGRNK